MRDLLAKMRRHLLFRNAVVMVAIEGNLNQIAAMELAHYIVQTDSNVVLMSETRKSTDGAVNGPYVLLDPHYGKERYARHATMFVHGYRLVFSGPEQFFTVDATGPRRFQEAVLTQLKNFVVSVKHPTDAVHARSSKKSYSGKKSGPDDVCMALLMGIYHYTLFLVLPTYHAIRKRAALQLFNLEPDMDSAAVQEVVAARQVIALETSPERGVLRLPWSPNNPGARRA